MQKSIFIVAILASILCDIGAASSQRYPSRPITMVVPASAGGPTDAIGRIIAERMGASLGQAIVIENISGAGGSIGVGRVAHATPDGYTIGVGHWGHYVVNGAIYSLRYDLRTDFEPVVLLATGPLIIATRKSIAASNLRELIDWLKSNSGRVSAGTGGVGTPAHIAGVLFEKMTDVQFQFVPYRGTGPAMLGLLAGDIDLLLDQASNILPNVQSRLIKAYAVTADSRLASAPEIPTVDDAGLPGFHVAVWHAIWAPKGTPKEIIDRLNVSARDALSDPTVLHRLSDLGQELPRPDQRTPEALNALHKAEIERWWPIIKAANIKAD
jgi:tripartite-type tricarboxylate transporter receptor subunit TctC